MKTYYILLIAFCTSLASCHRHQSSVGLSRYHEIDHTSNGSTLTGMVSNDKLLFEKSNFSRKVIFDARLSLTVKQPDSVSVRLGNIAKKYGGYVVESGSYSTQIRIESSQMDQAIKDISLLGKMEDKYIQGQDVSDEYEDLDIRLQNAERARKKYLELLDKAQNVAEGLLVEKELERLNGEIDGLKGKMNRMEHLVKFSTITIRLKQKQILGPLGLVSVGIYKLVKVLFVVRS
jgi:hypothetical protein